MIPYEEALAHILEHARPLPAERVPLLNALGRRLARDVIAREPVPRFDQSAVDGYAVRAADIAGASEATPIRLPLQGEIRAGQSKISYSQFVSEKSAIRNPQSAIRIFTGAPVPRHADAIVMKEVCEEDGASVLVRQAVSAGANIRRQGEELLKGAPALASGVLVTPSVVGLLATLGEARPWVHRLPRVALLVTGDELRDPGEPLKSGQIRDANTFALNAALQSLGVPCIDAARVPDDFDSLRRSLAGALASADVVITVGGVSVGAYDYIKDAAAALGVRTVYWKVAVKPGKPNYFGAYAKPGAQARAQSPRLLFGLPGNPVAALVSLHQFVRPALLQMSGALKPQPDPQYAILAAPCAKRPGRLEWVRGLLAPGPDGVSTVTPTTGQESHMLRGLATANCLIEFPADKSALQPGDFVRVIPLQWEPNV